MFHPHISGAKPAILRVTFRLHEYSVVKYLKSLDSIESVVFIG
jgi:hypothetical protein